MDIYYKSYINKAIGTNRFVTLWILQYYICKVSYFFNRPGVAGAVL